MINAFIMHKALTESVARGRFNNSIGTYPFVGDLSEATFNEATAVISTEALNVQELYTQTDQLMTEAVAEGVPIRRVEVMVENVFSKMFEAVKKFFEKIIEAVKGIIAKLKAFALRITGQTNKWLNAMEPKIKAAKKLSKASSAKAEMNDWNEKMFETLINGAKSDPGDDMWANTLNDISGRVEKLKSDFANIDTKGRSNIANAVDTPYTYKGRDGDVTGTGTYHYDNREGKELSDDLKKSNDSMIKNIEKASEEVEKKVEKEIKEFIKEISTDFGVSASDVDSMIDKIKTKLYGTKKLITYGNNVDKMMTAVENCKDLVSTVKDGYDKQLEAYNDGLDKIKDMENTVDDVDTDNAYGPFVTALKNNISAMLSNLTKEVQTVQSMTNRLKSLTTQAIKDRASDYMRVLTKFANTKNFSEQ